MQLGLKNISHYGEEMVKVKKIFAGFSKPLKPCVPPPIFHMGENSFFFLFF